MDTYLKAEYIFNKLNEKGAGLGNASIFIIKEALQDLEAAQRPLAPDGACPVCWCTKEDNPEGKA